MTDQPVEYPSDDQSEDHADVPAPAYRYLHCHGSIIPDQVANLCGTSVGVYTHFGETLQSPGAFAILLKDLEPVYELPDGGCPEFSLSPLSDAEAECWEEIDEVLSAGNIDSLAERITLSDYMSQYNWHGGKTKLRLLCCAARAGGSTRPAQLDAPQCWQRRDTSIKSDAIGSIFDEQVRGNTIMNDLAQLCEASWSDAVQHLNALSKADRAAILVRSGTGALIIKFWQAWPKLPPRSTSILDWQPFLEVLTPSTATALALYYSWEDERGNLRSLCQTLEDICKNIRDMLACCPPGVDVSFLDSFLSTGWAPEQPPEDPDLDAEFDAELDAQLAEVASPDDDGGVELGDPEPEQRGIKRPRDPAPGDDEPNTRHRPG